jgi:hypothetical protein
MENKEQQWPSLVKTLIEKSSIILSFIENCELDADANHGVTELGFKLSLLAGISEDLSVESERDVEGGRIDLLLSDTESVLVIELKYLRVGFLEWTRMSPNTGHKTKHLKWKKANDTVAGLSPENVIKVRVREYYNQKETLRSVDAISKNATQQAERYCKALREGGIHRLEEKKSLFYVVIIGIGKTVLSSLSEVKEYVATQI